MVRYRPTLPLICQANDIRPKGDLLLLLEGVQEMIDSLASDGSGQGVVGTGECFAKKLGIDGGELGIGGRCWLAEVAEVIGGELLGADSGAGPPIEAELWWGKHGNDFLPAGTPGFGDDGGNGESGVMTDD